MCGILAVYEDWIYMKISSKNHDQGLLEHESLWFGRLYSELFSLRIDEEFVCRPQVTEPDQREKHRRHFNFIVYSLGYNYPKKKWISLGGSLSPEWWTCLARDHTQTRHHWEVWLDFMIKTEIKLLDLLESFLFILYVLTLD